MEALIVSTGVKPGSRQQSEEGGKETLINAYLPEDEWETDPEEKRRPETGMRDSEPRRKERRRQEAVSTQIDHEIYKCKQGRSAASSNYW